MLGIEPEYLIGMKPISQNEESKESIKKIKPKSKKAKEPKSEDDDSQFEDDDEDGQIKIPLDVVRSTKELISDEFYQIVYIRNKTNEELVLEQQVFYLIEK